MHVITIDGFEYAAQTLAARAEMFGHASAARAAKSAGRDPGLSGFLACETAYVVEDQMDDVHAATHHGTCTCGLVTTDVAILGVHRSMRSALLAVSFVTRISEQEYAAACQRCLWQTPPATREDAFAARDRHRCPARRGS